MAFDERYVNWNRNKIKTIIDYYGHNYFFGKKILDLGCGHGDIGAAFLRLGADVLCVDGRQEHLDILKKKYPNIKYMKVDLDNEWPFENHKFDIILSLGILCHLKDHKKHLRNICNSGNEIILESEVCDSKDPNKYIVVNEHKSMNDWSLSGVGVKPSANNVEKILSEFNSSFKRFDIEKLNSNPYVYNWTVSDNGARKNNYRRFWIVRPNGSVPKDIKNIEIKNIQNNNTYKQTVQQNKENIKTAVCISGHLRSFEKTYNTIKDSILNRLNCDIFMHLWEPESLYEKSKALSKAKELFNPKKIIMEKHRNFELTNVMKSRIVDQRNHAAVLSMYYKINECNKLKIDFENDNNFVYDCVIRCRSDLFFENAININDIKNSNSIYLPILGNWHGYNDQFAFGPSHLMDIYSSLFNNINDYFDLGCIFDPEAMLKFHCDFYNIPVKRTNINYFILRENGSIFRNI